MKNHIVIKFIAVFLAALSLFGVLASATAIIGFTAGELYERPPEELLVDSLESRGQWFAQDLVQDYANQNLGNCPQDMLYGSSHIFNTGYYGYTLKDANGTVLESLAINSYRKYFTYTVGGEYMKVLETYPESEQVARQAKVIDNIPGDGCQVSSIDFIDENGTEHGFHYEVAGYLSREEDGTVIFTSQHPYGFEELNSISIQKVTFYDTDGNLIFSTSLGIGKAEITIFNNSYWKLVSAPAAATEASVPTESTMAYEEDDIIHYGYWDHTTQESMVAEFVWETMPEYTVELYLAPGAMDEEIYWDLLTEVWHYRNELFYVLGACLLVFAIAAVYLCCAAGRKPGREEIKADGFNAIPLDLYLGIGGFCIAFIFAVGYEVTEYLVRYSPKVLVPFLLFAGFGGCLIIVGFCFACAAQLKTPGGYWWRNLLVSRCIRLMYKAVFVTAEWMDEKFTPALGKLFKWLWRLIVWICRALWKICVAICQKICYFFDPVLANFFRWLWQKITRFFGLLPLMWQWLLTGAAMLLTVTIALMAQSEGFLVLSLCLGFALILHGASSFGTLLDAAKRMGKGDLESKVSDQFLVGSFKEFAGDLNALADVAVVAAQKQLRSERMKTELITNVSHDIKTPLTSIINYVDLLQKPHTEDEQEMYLEVLSRQSQQLKKLIEDLMEMSKASTGNMAVDIAAINAAEAIHQALGEFADKLDKAQLVPVFRQPEEPIYMKADGRLAWRVMSNLLGNAVKYALPGTRLYIDLMELEGKVIISFKNISREELNVSADELLERFVRGDASRNTEGSGLGLNIAQSLMEIQKGQLELLVDGDLFKVTLIFPAVKE